MFNVLKLLIVTFAVFELVVVFAYSLLRKDGVRD